jgi:DNA-binding NtrC family response regulator
MCLGARLTNEVRLPRREPILLAAQARTLRRVGVRWLACRRCVVCPLSARDVRSAFSAHSQPAYAALGADRTAPLVGVSAPGPASAKLVVLSGSAEGIERALDRPLTLGSDADCDIRLLDRGVSRQHARFVLREGRAWVVDLDSRNGTYVESTRIKEAELPLGVVVRLGETPIGVYPRLYTREVEPSTRNQFGDLYGCSLAMREVFAVLERVAACDSTVLIEGESGTGKELAARSLHRASARADGPYVVCDCTTISKELAESELFGHRRGSFSGAVADHEGAFQQADGGTIFLDELGELPADLQPKLLRVLESGEVRRVGDNKPQKVDVRVIAATNRSLKAEARRGRFRSDLLYRLAVVCVRLPPLRARPEDIAGITEQLLGDRLSEGERVAGPNLQRLTSYCWPGNVRELRNCLNRAHALATRASGKVKFDDLVLNLAADEEQPATLGFSFPGVDVPLPYKDAKQRLMAQFESAYVQSLLHRHGGNITQAAKAAGLSRKHLYELLGHLGTSEAGDEG